MRDLRKRLRFDLVEVSLLIFLVALVVWKIGASRPLVVAGSWELKPLADKYGPARSSQFAEEWIIRDFFGDRRRGFFVDVGANDYKVFSNTYYLDTVLGWSGIAVEPQRQFEQGYTLNRPRTKFRPFFVSNESNTQAKLYVQAGSSLETSANEQFTASFGTITKELTAPTITLTDLLESEKVDSIDFLTMDIELWEPKALAGFDIERFRPAFVCIEAHPVVRQQILDYFSLHAYTVVGKYLRADTQNLYFMPRSALESSRLTARPPQLVEGNDYRSVTRRRR